MCIRDSGKVAGRIYAAPTGRRLFEPSNNGTQPDREAPPLLLDAQSVSYTHLLDNLADKVSIQLNDTHPTVAIPEMMRILLDECSYEDVYKRQPAPYI